MGESALLRLKRRESFYLLEFWVLSLLSMRVILLSSRDYRNLVGEESCWRECFPLEAILLSF